MFRDYLYSFIGHIVVIGGLAVGAQFTLMPPPPMINIYQVQAVSSQSVADLIEQVEQASKPKPSVPQIKTPAPALPQEHRKQAQAVKRSAPEKANAAVSNKKAETAGVQGIRTDTTFEFPEYLMGLQEQIRGHWQPPTLMNAVNTRVYFKIGRTGKLMQVYVEQPTGNIAFDSSALKAVIACDPFPPLPDGYKEDHLGVHFDFIYRTY